MNNNNTLDVRDTSARFLEMYGVPSIGAWYDEQIDYFWKMKGADKMLVMSMLSDVQEMVERGLAEEARQTLNRAKWVISNKL